MIKNKKRAIPNFFIALVLVAGISWVCGRFVHLSDVEFTDNAQIQQHLTPVSTCVQGFIKKICFEEYQNVKVEQRIPVRIEFTPNNSKEALQRLRAGMNAECYVEQ